MSIQIDEPAAITAGDTVAWRKTLADYPASASWVLTYALRNATDRIDITASASGADHQVSVAASVSRAWAPGRYDWAAYATKAGERYEVARGQITVRPNLQQATSIDGRSHAQRTLDAIEAVIEGRATKDQEEYTIGDRSLKRTPLADLVMLHKRYQRLVSNERDAAAIAAGRPNPSRFAVRFGG